MKALLLDLDGTLLDHRAAADAGIAGWVTTLLPAERHPADLVMRWTALEEHHVSRGASSGRSAWTSTSSSSSLSTTSVSASPTRAS